MPYANNNGVKIYYEVEGQGPAIVLVHGAADDMSMWRRRGHVNALKDNYQLILVDARGHGRSDKPFEVNAYGTTMTEDVITLIDTLGISMATYCGYSMGAWIGFMLTKKHLKRFNSFILGGWAPLRDDKLVKMDKENADGLKLLVLDPEAAFKQRERSVGRPFTDEEKKRLLSTNSRALAAVFGSMVNESTFTTKDLSRINVPCLVYCGDLDPQYQGVKMSTSSMPIADFVSLPGLDHVTAFARSDIMIPRIKEFLAQVKKV